MASYLYTFDPFDSKIFSERIAKITHIAGTPKAIDKSIKELIATLQEDQIKYATYRIPSSDFLKIQKLEQNGFKIVDGIVSFVLQIDKNLNSNQNDIRIAVRGDIESLQNIARVIFTATRFYNDSFTKSKAGMVYSEWIKNAVIKTAADEVLVYSHGKEIEGFVSIKDSGSISLVGVKKSAQGKGVGKKLCNAAISYLQNKGCGTISIETQINNIPAMRTYLSCGFKPSASYITLRWLNES